MGLLSDLAAVGFARFRAAMEAKIRKSDPAPARLEAIGRGCPSASNILRHLTSPRKSPITTGLRGKSSAPRDTG
jgi:hypothetical protein